MKKKNHLLFISSILISMPLWAQDYENIYPFKPIDSEEIVKKTKYLSEDDKAIVNILDIERYQLSEGQPKNLPWSGSYWPLKQGMIANPYLEKNIFHSYQYIPYLDGISEYNKRKNYVMTQEAQLSEKELAKLAPSEKYDLLLGNSLDLSTKIWDFINNWKGDMKWNYLLSIDLPGDEWVIEKKNYVIATWEGICHGWAPAAGVVPKPEKTVVVTLPDGRKMPFFPEDIKGLISLTWANSLIQDRVLWEGLRCRQKRPKRDEFGRYYDHKAEKGELLPRCADIHPAILHLALVNLTGKQGRSFIFDKNAKDAVANQPVAGYKFEYFDPQTGKDGGLRDSLIPYENYTDDPFAKSRHPSTKYVIGVESTLTYTDWTLIKKPNSKDYLKDQTSKMKYLYDLEVDANGNIVGGQWRGLKKLDPYTVAQRPYMETNHPDFIWVIPKDYKESFKPVPGLEDWDIRSGTPAPRSWADASIAAHSFQYELSKKYNNHDLCRVKNTKTKEIEEVPCEFRFPKPQPLIQVVDQLIEYSSNR